MPLTLIDRVYRRLHDFGGETVVEEEGVSLSGAEIWSMACAVRDELIDLDVGPGSRVALSLRPSIDLYVAIVATWLTGAAFVPLDPVEAPRRRDIICDDS